MWNQFGQFGLHELAGGATVVGTSVGGAAVVGTIVEGRIRVTIAVGKKATPAVPWWLLLLLEKESPPAVFFLLLLLSSLLMLETSYTGRSLVAVVGRNLPRQVLFGEPAAAGSAAVVIRSNTSSSLVVVVGRNCLGGAVVVVSGRLEETTPSLPNYTISSLKFHRQFLIELGPEKIPWLLLLAETYPGSCCRLQVLGCYCSRSLHRPVLGCCCNVGHFGDCSGCR